jgi:hypothetical protein
MIDNEFLDAFSKQILYVDNSIRWIAIVNELGIILKSEYREGLLDPLMTQDENEEYAKNTVTRHKTRTRFEPKMGKVVYVFGRYEKLIRATIPINDNYYLLITLDVREKNYDDVIMEKVIPIMQKEKTNFVIDKDADS